MLFLILVFIICRSLYYNPVSSLVCYVFPCSSLDISRNTHIKVGKLLSPIMIYWFTVFVENQRFEYWTGVMLLSVDVKFS